MKTVAMNTSELGTLRELSEIEIDQVSGGCHCSNCRESRPQTPSWQVYDCEGRAYHK
jgi:hypothetical protein